MLRKGIVLAGLFRSAQPGSLWKRYVLALGLLVAIVFAGHAVQRHALHQANADAMLVNISGKQRMLSQQIVLYADATANDSLPGANILLASKINEFERAHNFLAETAANTPGLTKIYTDGAQPLDHLVRRFIADSRAFMETSGDTTALRNLYRVGTGQMLSRLDRAVTSFERAADNRATRIRQIEDFTLLVALLVIMLEAALIFLPAHRAVKDSHEKLLKEVDNQQIANRRLTDFVDIASDLYWETDMAGHVTFIEGRLFERLKGTRDDLLGCHYNDIIRLTPEAEKTILDARGRRQLYDDVDAEFIDTDGTIYVLRLGGKPRFGADGTLIGFLGRAHEVTSEVNLLGEVTRQALTDPLTGVANKRAFKQDLNEAIQTATEDSPLTLLALDLDMFKPVNDTYGHGVGDEVLKIVAARLQSVSRTNDWVARLGGDEFNIICPNTSARDALNSVAARVLEKIRQPIGLDSGIVVQIGVSIGIASIPHDAESYRDLMAAADAALYEAKRRGRNCALIAGDTDEDVVGADQNIMRLAI